MKPVIKKFSDYKSDAANWITLAGGEFYPDILQAARNLYKPVLILFGQLLQSSETSSRLFTLIQDVSEVWMRIQLLRVFKRYVCPSLPVEMTKRKTKAQELLATYSREIRSVQDVQRAFKGRPPNDEVMCALLWEYKDRGKKGYDLTERFFDLFRSHYPDLTLIGPERAGKDILLGNVWPDYPKADRPVDFIVKSGDAILAVGLARYDSDRGGAQEDDRTGGYANCAKEFFGYTRHKRLKSKLIFLNDGPGLLLGSMWNDYSALEKTYAPQVMVLTLRMFTERLTKNWLIGKE